MGWSSPSARLLYADKESANHNMDEIAPNITSTSRRAASLLAHIERLSVNGLTG